MSRGVHPVDKLQWPTQLQKPKAECVEDWPVQTETQCNGHGCRTVGLDWHKAMDSQRGMRCYSLCWTHKASNDDLNESQLGIDQLPEVEKLDKQIQDKKIKLNNEDIIKLHSQGYSKSKVI